MEPTKNAKKLITVSDGDSDAITKESPPSVKEPKKDAQAEDDQPEEVPDVPVYTTMFTGFLTTPEFSMETGRQVKNDKRLRKSCFNCLGEHTVSECPQPLNQTEIGKNRRAHMANRPANSVRYHELVSNKYGHFAPGVMSAELRHALGLNAHQVSETVYRMRLLGYPPGWLKEAREETGEVVLIGGDGKAVCQPGGEDGEVAGGAKYLPEKLVEFPGFNTPLPSGIEEESHHYNLPPINASHKLSRWRKVMNRNRATPYRKRKMKRATTGAIATPPPFVLDATAGDEDSSTVEDSEAPSCKRHKPIQFAEEGEITEIADTSSKSKRSKKSKKKSKKDESIIELDGDSTQGTITLDDTIKTETDDFSILLDTEPSPVEDGTQPEIVDVNDDDSKHSSTKKSSSTNGVSGSKPSSERSSSPSDDDSNPSTPDTTLTPAALRIKNHRRAGSKGFVLGAVIPDSITEFVALPDVDKWTVDVSDHILFENLPDALGTWDTMRDIMKRVRTKLSELDEEE